MVTLKLVVISWGCAGPSQIPLGSCLGSGLEIAKCQAPVRQLQGGKRTVAIHARLCSLEQAFLERQVIQPTALLQIGPKQVFATSLGMRHEYEYLMAWTIMRLGLAPFIEDSPGSKNWAASTRRTSATDFRTGAQKTN